jgi:hypothetical protein
MTHPDHRHIPIPLDTITGITAALGSEIAPERALWAPVVPAIAHP